MELRSVAAVLTALTCFAPIVEPNVSIGGPPKSLFIAACDVDVTATVKQLNYICQYHRVPSGQNQTIKSLALLTTSHYDAAASTYAVPPTANDALCWDKLKPLIPYFPGGNGPCTFDNVYVGQLHINEANPPGHAQCASHSNFKGNVSLVNPNVKWDWYLSQEHFFEFTVYNQGLNDGWVRYISKLMIGLNGVLPNRQFLWSPAFAYNAFQYIETNPTLLQILDNAKNFFLRVQGNISASIPACASASTCPFWLSPQDYVGSYGVGHLNNTMHSAGLWMKRLKSVYPFPNFSVNVEQFNHNWWNDPYATKGNMYFNGDCLELQDREAYYTSLGFSLGPAYAMHMWYGCNHPDDGSYCDAGWTKYNQFCYRKQHWAFKWADAEAECVKQGGHLASVHSKRENDFVTNLDFTGETSIWVGLGKPFHYYYDVYKAGIENGTALFQWTDDSPMLYTNWSPNTPGKSSIGVDTTCQSSANVGKMCFPSTVLEEATATSANGGGQWANAGCGWYAGAFVCKKRPYNAIY